jgi:hypothetical protein
MKIFLAHPKDYPSTAELIEVIRRLLPPQAQAAEIVPGEVDFQHNFARFNGWEGWVQSVGLGTEYNRTTGMLGPRYTSIIVAPETRIGRATQGMVRYAIQAQKPVWFCDGVRLLTPVRFLNVIDPGDMRRGWEVVP